MIAFPKILKVFLNVIITTGTTDIIPDQRNLYK